MRYIHSVHDFQIILLANKDFLFLLKTYKKKNSSRVACCSILIIIILKNILNIHEEGDVLQGYLFVAGFFDIIHFVNNISPFNLILSMYWVPFCKALR